MHTLSITSIIKKCKLTLIAEIWKLSLIYEKKKKYFEAELLNFMSDSLPIPKTLVHESVISKTIPKVWWSSIERSNSVNKTLCQLAMKLLSMPSSSASLERVFSNFGVIQTKLRNRLGLQKAAKLVFCYRFLRGKENIDWWNSDKEWMNFKTFKTVIEKCSGYMYKCVCHFKSITDIICILCIDIW